MGLGLPSEAQWERGCRGGTGTDTPWWPGAEPESLRGVANLVDTYARDHGGALWPEVQEWLDDGATVHAPVGTYAPNGLGLHDVHGNVWEWCLDGYDIDFYGRSPVRDPLAPWEGTASRVIRGGSFLDVARLARSAYRPYDKPSNAVDRLGVRPARTIDP